MARKALIYKITNDINEKIYVGQTWIGLQKRFKRHCAEATWKNTKRMPIVLAIKKYGKKHFKIGLLEELPDDCNQNTVDEREVFWSNKSKSLSPLGYNLKVGGARGKVSEGTKLKISESHKGRRASKETIEKLRISHLGYKVTEEAKRKLSEFNTGKRLSKEHIEKIRLSNIGRVTSEDTKKKQRFKKIKYLYTLISPSGKVYKTNNLEQFLKKHGLKSHLYDVMTKKAKQYRGWTGYRNKIKSGGTDGAT